MLIIKLAERNNQ